jgi:hypothetical protein
MATMNIDRLNRVLERAFRNTRPKQAYDAQVRRLRKPLPLAPLLDTTLDTDEVELYAGTFEEWPGNVDEILRYHGLERSLLTFNWDGFGPVSWSAGLTAIETGGHAYVCKWDEVESYQLLSAVTPAGDTAALAQVAVDAIADGSIVRQPPHYVWNDAPGLLDRATIEHAFARLLDSTQGWGELADDHFGRIVEPDHLRRCLDLLEGLPRLDDEEALSAWLERIEDDGSDLGEPARRLLLKEFLDRGYEEAA